MHLHLHYTIQEEFREKAELRFKETGALPPDGVHVLSRWHEPGSRQGFMIIEAHDSALIAKFMREWTDVMSFDIVPVINDEQLMQLMK